MSFRGRGGSSRGGGRGGSRGGSMNGSGSHKKFSGGSDGGSRGGFSRGGFAGRGGGASRGGRPTPRKIYSKPGTHPSELAKSSSTKKKAPSGSTERRARQAEARSQLVAGMPTQTRAQRSRASFAGKDKRAQAQLIEKKKRKRGGGSDEEDNDDSEEAILRRMQKQPRTETNQRPSRMTPTASKPTVPSRQLASDSEDEEDTPRAASASSSSSHPSSSSTSTKEQRFKKAGGLGKRPKSFLDKSSSLSLLNAITSKVDTTIQKKLSREEERNNALEKAKAKSEAKRAERKAKLERVQAENIRQMREMRDGEKKRKREDSQRDEYDVPVPQQKSQSQKKPQVKQENSGQQQLKKKQKVSIKKE